MATSAVQAQQQLDWTTCQRICNILERRVLASIEQLLVKTGECGRDRTDPARLRTTLDYLEQVGFVSSLQGPDYEPFYHLASAEPERLAARMQELYPVMESWQLYRQDRSQLLCLVKEAIGDHLPYGCKGNTVYMSNGEREIALLVLNELDWLHPADRRLWAHIEQCLASGQHPAVLTRKAYPTCKKLLTLAGIPVKQTGRLCFSPVLEDLLLPVKDKDLGGIKDITLVDQLPEPLSAWINVTLWHKRVKRFLASKDVLAEYALRILASSQPDSLILKLWQELEQNPRKKCAIDLGKAGGG